MRRLRPTSTGWLLLGVTMLGLTLRAARAYAPTAWLEADESVAALMAERIAAGRHVYTFMAGQTYMGPFEQYVQAALLRVVAPTAAVLRSVPLAFGTATIPVVFMVARRVTGSPWRSLLAAALFAVGPYYLIYKSGYSHPTYASAMLCETLAFLAAISLDGSRRDRLLAAAVGFLAAFSVWLNPQTLAFLLPVGIWVAADVRRTWQRTLLPLIAGLVTGAMPLLVWIVRYGRLPGLNPQGHPPIGMRLRGLYDLVIGEFLGFRGNYDAPVFHDSPLVAAIVTPLAIGVLIAAAVARRRGLWALLRLDVPAREPRDLVLAVFVLWPVFYLASTYTWFTGEPRYLFMLYPLLAVGIAALAPSWLRGTAATSAAAAVLAAISICTLLQLRVLWNYAGPGPDPAAVRAIARVFATSGQPYVYGDYWAAWPLQLFGGDKLVVEAYASSAFPHNAVAVAAAAHPAYVAQLGVEQVAIESAFAAAHVRYRRVIAGMMVAYLDVTPRADPWLVGLAARAGAVIGR